MADSFRRYSTRELRQSTCRCYQDRLGRTWRWFNGKGAPGRWECFLGPDGERASGEARRNNSMLSRILLKEVWT